MNIESAGRRAPRFQNTPGVPNTVSKWPAKTELPELPGNTPGANQPTSSARAGTSICPFASSPTEMTGESMSSRGMRIRTGILELSAMVGAAFGSGNNMFPASSTETKMRTTQASCASRRITWGTGMLRYPIWNAHPTTCAADHARQCYRTDLQSKGTHPSLTHRTTEMSGCHARHLALPWE